MQCFHGTLLKERFPRGWVWCFSSQWSRNPILCNYLGMRHMLDNIHFIIHPANTVFPSERQMGVETNWLLLGVTGYSHLLHCSYLDHKARQSAHSLGWNHSLVATRPQVLKHQRPKVMMKVLHLLVAKDNAVAKPVPMAGKGQWICFNPLFTTIVTEVWQSTGGLTVAIILVVIILCT